MSTLQSNYHHQSVTIRQKTSVGREGQLRLRFENYNNRTTMMESYFRTPLQIMKAIPDGDNGLCLYLLSPTGGVVQYDRYNLEINLGDSTHVLVTTVAATKVYGMPEGKAIQHTHINIGENAILEFVPDALVLFANSDFEQHITIQLDTGAVCLFQDSVMGGRIAYQNEFLQFRQLQNRLKIYDRMGLLVYDAVSFSPSADDAQRIGLLDGYTCWGSAYIVGDVSRLNCDALAFCQQIIQSQSDNVLASISELHRGGFVFKVLSNRLEFMEQSFEQVRRSFREALGIRYTKLRK